MTANPDLPGRVLKRRDVAPTHKHPTKRYMQECRNLRPCSVCIQMTQGPDHHKVPKSHFKLPGSAKEYYNYADFFWGRVYKDAYANRTTLCQQCHEAWHNAFGTGPIRDTVEDRKARLRGIRKWGEYVDKHCHPRRRHDTVMHDTVPQAWIDEWCDEMSKKEARRG